MKNNELYSYVNNFLSLLYFKKGFLDHINSIILFGSSARDTTDNESDVDIFIDIKSKRYEKEVNELVKSAINEFEIKAKETWHLRGINNPIKCIVGLIEDKTWHDLKQEMESYAKVLYGSLKANIKGLESHSLFEYSLKSFKQKNRVAFQRELLGYKSKKKKTYIHKGLIDELNGVHLKNNNIIVSSKETNKLQKFFIKNKVTPKIKEIWIK